MNSKWLQDLERVWDHKSTVILCGHIRDLYLYQPTEDHAVELLDLKDVLRRWLPRSSKRIVFYDPVDRFEQVAPQESEQSATTGGAAGAGESAPVQRDIARIARDLREGSDCTYVVQFADHVAPAGATDEDRASVLALEKLVPDIPAGSHLILVYLSEDRIPVELSQNEPRSVVLTIAAPDRRDLRQLLTDFYNFNEADTARALNLFFGLSFFEIRSILDGAGSTDLDVIEKAVRVFRFGRETNYWDELGFEKLRSFRTFCEAQVKGQPQAIDKVQTVLVRARADIQRTTGGNPGRPRGALFFAGPTGVGKTRMAQRITEFLFGDRRHMVRFDMSEYAEEYQVSRLYGAPPGYIGFDQGGTLTNAVRTNPFSVLLFDEIEKVGSNTKIFDIFLQVLDDGRLTDSRGTTSQFSESFIIFTSNLGADTANAEELDRLKGDATARREHFVGAVEEYFIDRLGRPELLNRIGRDNIVVFNFIDSEETARSILLQELRTITDEFNKSYAVRVPRLRLDVPLDEAAALLYRLDADRITAFGGREVSNLVNARVRDELAYAVLEAESRGLPSAVIRVGISGDDLTFDIAEA
jgi:DNA replication protein DnaC